MIVLRGDIQKTALKFVENWLYFLLFSARRRFFCRDFGIRKTFDEAVLLKFKHSRLCDITG